jgi:hypothetical protein
MPIETELSMANIPVNAIQYQTPTLEPAGLAETRVHWSHRPLKEEIQSFYLSC